MTQTAENTIGTILRDRRLELGIGFEEIVARTRIRRAYLEDLEAERFEAFPGDAYLKGYLKSYAECLGLDPQPLLQAFGQLNPPAPNPAPSEVAPLPPLANPYPGPPGRKRKVVMLVGGLAVLFLGWVLVRQQPSDSPREIAAPAPVVEAPATLPPDPAGPAIPDERLAPAAAAIASAPVQPGPDSVVAAVEPGTSPGLAQGAPEPPVSPPAEDPPKASVAPPPGSGIGVLRLQATGPGQLELTIDGRPAQHYTLQANTVLSWKVARSARIYLENPGNARLWLSGREVDLAGRNQLVLNPGEEASR